MISFPLAALVVFISSVAIFFLVFVAAIRLRLIPVQAEVQLTVDKLFSNASNQPAEQLVIAGTASGVYVGPAKRNGLALATVSTMAVATLCFVQPPIERQVTSVMVQIGRGEGFEIENTQQLQPAEFIIWKTQGEA